MQHVMALRGKQIPEPVADGLLAEAKQQMTDLMAFIRGGR
jgi:hypothetical protein